MPTVHSTRPRVARARNQGRVSCISFGPRGAATGSSRSRRSSRLSHRTLHRDSVYRFFSIGVALLAVRSAHPPRVRRGAAPRRPLPFSTAWARPARHAELPRVPVDDHQSTTSGLHRSARSEASLHLRHHHVRAPLLVPAARGERDRALGPKLDADRGDRVPALGLLRVRLRSHRSALGAGSTDELVRLARTPCVLPPTSIGGQLSQDVTQKHVAERADRSNSSPSVVASLIGSSYARFTLR